MTFIDDGTYARDPIVFRVPNTTEVEIDVKLAMLWAVEVWTTRGGTPVSARVQVTHNQTGDPDFDGNTLDNGEGRQRFIANDPQPEGWWWARAQDLEGGPWSAWQAFTVEYSWIPVSVDIEVPAG